MQVSTAGGVQPEWRGDGKELFYIQGGSTMMAVPVVTGSAFQHGPPAKLFTAGAISFGSRTFSYQPAPDGQRFLMMLPPVKADETFPLTVVQNWEAGLKK